MSSTEVVIEARNVSKRYEIYATPRDRLKQMILPRLIRGGRRLAAGVGIDQPEAAPQYFREFWALRDITFQVRGGETLGIIGRNGSGKSTLLQILAGTMAPTAGEVAVNGRVAALLELGSGFNPEFTGRENVLLNARILGLTQREIEARYDQIVEFADIGEFIEQPVKTYSSGMFVRLAFAVQAHIDAAVVIIDEALAVGDVFFTQKCFRRLHELVSGGAAVVFVSHDMAAVTQFCTKALVLDHGREQYRGNPVAAIRRYMAQDRDALGSLQKRSGAAHAALGKASGASNRGDDSFWPAPEDFFSPAESDVVANGQAEFLGVALCSGQTPSTVFETGEPADFFYEFRALDEIDVPIGGITIVNEKNIIVHGKNSLQHGIDVPAAIPRGAILRFHQRIVLDLAPGEYTFVVGLAATDRHTYENTDVTSHAALSGNLRRLVSAGNAGKFTVSLRLKGLALPHHGVCGLPGECQLTVLAATEPALPQ